MWAVITFKEVQLVASQPFMFGTAACFSSSLQSPGPFYMLPTWLQRYSGMSCQKMLKSIFCSSLGYGAGQHTEGSCVHQGWFVLGRSVQAFPRPLSCFFVFLDVASGKIFCLLLVNWALSLWHVGLSWRWACCLPCFQSLRPLIALAFWKW